MELFSLYTNKCCRGKVDWGGVISYYFSVINGVKHYGAVLSPVLLCIYIYVDNLLVYCLKQILAATSRQFLLTYFQWRI